MLQVEPRAIKLGPVPDVVQVCVCGAVLRRLTRGEAKTGYYFWWNAETGQMEPRRAFRSEDKAGVHCHAAVRFGNRIGYLAWACPGLTPEAWGPHAWFVPPYRKSGEECKKCGRFKDEPQHKAEVRERLGVGAEVQHGA